MAATLVLLMGSTPMVTLPFNAPAGIVRETIPSDDVMVPPDAPISFVVIVPLETPTGRANPWTGFGCSGFGLSSFLHAVPVNIANARRRLIHFVCPVFIQEILRNML